MIGRYSKSIATLLTGVNGWLLFVVHSKPGPITSDEWALLVGIGIAFVLTFLVPNAPASVPAPPKTPAQSIGGSAMTVVGGSYEPVPSKAAQP